MNSFKESYSSKKKVGEHESYRFHRVFELCFQMIFLYVSHACNSVQIGLSLLLGFVKKSFQKGKCNSLSKENHGPCLCLGQLGPTEQGLGAYPEDDQDTWPGPVLTYAVRLGEIRELLGC